MIRTIAVFLCGALAACSQTAGQDAGHNASAASPPAAASRNTATGRYAALNARCDAAVQRQQKAAVMGSALSMVGGFAGMGGRSAAIAGHAASVGGSLVAAGAQSSARSAVEKECMP